MNSKNFLITVFFSICIAWANAATVDTLMVFSSSMGKNVPCAVVKPDSYRKGKTRYPVVYLLHGYSGSYRTWAKDYPAVKTNADLYQMIIVCPDGGFSSWYFDSPADPKYKYETFAAKELVNYIDKNFRTVPDRTKRAISGLSMGGHGAFYLGVRHADTFGAVGSMSGGVDIRPFPEKWEIKKRLGSKTEFPGNWEKYTVINQVDSLKDKQLAITFDCGIDDFFIDVNRNLHEKLLKMKIAHDYTERPGAHNKAYWENSILYHLLFFNKFFQSK